MSDSNTAVGLEPRSATSPFARVVGTSANDQVRRWSVPLRPMSSTIHHEVESFRFVQTVWSDSRPVYLFACDGCLSKKDGRHAHNDSEDSRGGNQGKSVVFFLFAAVFQSTPIQHASSVRLTSIRCGSDGKKDVFFSYSVSKRGAPQILPCFLFSCYVSARQACPRQSLLLMPEIQTLGGDWCCYCCGYCCCERRRKPHC